MVKLPFTTAATNGRDSGKRTSGCGAEIIPAARTANTPGVADFSGTKPTAAEFMPGLEAMDDFVPGLQL